MAMGRIKFSASTKAASTRFFIVDFEPTVLQISGDVVEAVEQIGEGFTHQVFGQEFRGFVLFDHPFADLIDHRHGLFLAKRLAPICVQLMFTRLSLDRVEFLYPLQILIDIV